MASAKDLEIKPRAHISDIDPLEIWCLIVDLQTRGYCVSRIAWPYGRYVLVVTKLGGDGDDPPATSDEEPYGGATDELRALRAVVERVEPSLLGALNDDPV